MIIVYVTFPNKEEAEELVTKLVETKLIACATIFPVTAISGWGGKTESVPEFVAMLKTKESLRGEVEAFVSKNHSYQVPCILNWKAEANKKYNDWINEVTK